MIGSPISVLNFFVDLVASPINNVIKPLSAYTKIPPVALVLLFSGIGAAIMYGFMIGALTFSLATSLLILPYLTIALNIYSIYPLYQFVQAGTKAVGDMTIPALSLGFLVLLGFIPSGDLVNKFLLVVANLCYFQILINALIERPVEFFPLPEQPVPDDVKQAVQLGYTKANQSHRFFGTPKDAEVQHDRTFWQKSASFFGVDSLKPKEAAFRFEETGRHEEGLRAICP